ncbi:hypothetical protein SAMN05444156_2148 [Verrucomicrobium sp. GAS474]|uniref:hypothetical protein n=1 Tax=Verrucomicrobium sp. GAS474 TaxID=1882831 RepID=UPI00087DA3EA|nr:hypothetical protein [Verrucomicrobium sp. GAS474]SDU13221.1 hypothetical protein SAMN05444156_2148 [Verrucomicrobium sp. GAS474]
MECTLPTPASKEANAAAPVTPLHALVVSRDRECLTSCCYKLGTMNVTVHGAPSTDLGSRMFEWKHYDILVIDPKGIDWHRLQLHVARCSLQHRKAMPIVAVLQRDGSVVPHQWGEGNDYDEVLSFPLRREELESFLASCACYCPYS